MKRLVVEGVGTLLIALAGIITGNENPLAIGLAIFVLMYLARRISGGHFNPAVSVANWLSGRLAPQLCAWYVASQLVGAFAARVLTGASISDLPVNITALDSTIVTIVEVVLTLLLCLVFLRAQRDESETKWISLIVGATYVGMLSIGGLLNPAIAAGAYLFGVVRGVVVTDTLIMTILIGAPLLGAVVAALILPTLDKWSAK